MEDATLGRIGGFRLIKRLATGGTSDVLLARAEGPHGFERTVVLKRLRNEHRNDPDFARMFAREAAAYARLSHPAIVRLFDFFTANGQLVMVLEYVDGISLARLMTQAAQGTTKLDDRVCFFLAARIFDALSAAHDAQSPDSGEPTPVIHRDVNPSNVLIPWDGHAKLADFGIAKITGAGSSDFGADTTQGLIKGTYGYMAPEQVRAERVTIRTDVYAASLVLWELLTRRKAIQADKLPEMEVLRAMAEPNLPKLDVLRPDVHESIREAVSRGLEPNPARRAITAEEMMGILRAHFDPEDARMRLVRALQPLAPRRSQADTVITEDMIDTAVGFTFPPPADRPVPATTLAMQAPSPTAAQRGSAPAIGLQQTVAMAGASGLEPARQPMPSGLRPITSTPGGGVRVASGNTPTTIAGGFAPMPPPVAVPSDVPTQKNQRVDATVALPDGSGPMPPMQLVNRLSPAPVAPLAPQLSPAPPPYGPAAVAPPAYAPAPVPTARRMDSAPPRGLSTPMLPKPLPRRTHAAAVAAAVISGLALGAIAALLVYTKSPSVTQPAASTSAQVAHTTPPKSTATTTARAIATSTPTQTTASASAATVAATPTATTADIATAAPKPSAAAGDPTSHDSMPAVGPDEGVIILPAYAHDHRIYVDGHVKGDGTAPIVVACGKHRVQVGSSGRAHELDVPCGAQARFP